MIHPFSAIVTSSGAITFTDRDGQSHTIVRDNGRYEEAKELLFSINNAAAADGTPETERADPFINELVKIATPVKAISSESGGKINVREGVVYYNDGKEERALHNVVADRILWLLNEKFDARPMILFTQMLIENPSYRAVNDTYRFMEQNKMGITPDGFILAYKKVRSDYKDIYSQSYDNHPGQTAKMPRNEVEDNPQRLCSNGLHVCAYGYLKQYGSEGNRQSDRVVVCKINPRDVVSVPVDHNDAKMRVCEYEVLYEVENYKQKDHLSAKPVIDPARAVVACPNCGGDEDWYKDGYCRKCGHEDEPASEDDAAAEDRHTCPNCGESDAFYKEDEREWRCIECGYERHGSDGDDDSIDQVGGLHAEHEPEEPPVIEFRDNNGVWRELANHGCSTRDEAENYVRAVGEGVRVKPESLPEAEWPFNRDKVEQFWPGAEPEDINQQAVAMGVPKSTPESDTHVVDLRDAVSGVDQAASAMYPEGTRVDVKMALDGEGGLQVNIKPDLTKPEPLLFQKVKRVIAEHLGVDADEVTEEKRLQSDLGADSLDGVELMMAMEEEFSIEITDPDAERLTDATVGEVVRFIDGKLDHPLR